MDLTVTSQTWLAEPFEFIISDVTPGAIAQITTSVVDAAGVQWESVNQFRANGAGEIDLNSTLPVDAAWAHACSLGLLWTLTPQGHQDAVFTVSGEYQVKIRVRCEGKGKSVVLRRRVQPQKEAAAALPVVVILQPQPVLSELACQQLAASGFQVLVNPEQLPPRCALIGQGLGADQALMLAAAQPEQVWAVVAHSPLGVALPFSQWQENTGEKLARKLSGKPTKVDKIIGRLQEEAEPAQFLAQLAQITCPVLFSDARVNLELPKAAKNIEIQTAAARFGTAAEFGACFPFAQAGLPWQQVAGELDFGGDPVAIGFHNLAVEPAVVDFLDESFRLV